ncbi:MAG: hypothetical protein GY862_34555, partial [Gammaproteobacteria bacterium]|nr:hypothetical protein [Gammaproteobacteria bacterium]
MDIIHEILNALRMLPVVIPRWVWMALAVLTVLLLLYVLYRRRAPGKPPEEQPPPPLPQETDGDEAVTAAAPAEKTKAAGKRGLEKVFIRLLKQLRKHVVGKNYRYRVPWLLLLGESGAGKSTLSARMQLNMPFGAPTPSPDGCDAWLFDNGIVFDVAGRYVLDSSRIGSDEEGWRNLLALLRKHRPRRPVNGIILAIACGGLLAGRENPEILANKADYLYHKLWEAQKALGMRLPVYILVTQCDELTGFSAFCNTIPERLHSNIFGWSNPYSADSVYNSDLGAEAFQKIYREINELQLELVVDRGDIPRRDEFMAFPHQFRPLFKQLQAVLDCLFQPSAYHEAFFFRGIYFCGDVTGEGQALSRSSSSPSDQLAFEPRLEQKPFYKKVVFLKHLFENKIFPESELARPVERSLQKRTRVLWTVQALLAVMIIIGALGQWLGYRRLNEDIATIFPVLNTISEDIDKIDEAVSRGNAIGGGTQAELDETISAGAENLLTKTFQIRTGDLSSMFLPPSWGNTPERMIVKALELAHEDIISAWLYRGLERKTKDVFSGGGSVTSSSPSGDVYNKLLEFLESKQLLENFDELEKNVILYNGLQKKHHVGTIKKLVHYTYGIYLSGAAPEEKKGEETLPEQAMSEVDFRHFELDEYSGEARQQVRDSAKRWWHKLFTESVLLKDTRALVVAMDRVNAGIPPSQLAASLRVLQADMDRIEQKLAKPEWQWVKHSRLIDDHVFRKFFLDIAGISVLGGKFSMELHLEAEEHFQRFRKELFGLRNAQGEPVIQSTAPSPETAGTGSASLLDGVGSSLPAQAALGLPVSGASQSDASQPAGENKTASPSSERMDAITTAKLPSKQNAEASGGLKLSAAPVAAKETLETFMRQKFMQSSPGRQLRPWTSPNMRQTWDPTPLKEALSLAEQHKKYMADELPKASPQLRTTLDEAGQASLYKNMLNLTADAQRLESASLTARGSYLEEQLLRADVQNFSPAAPLIDDIINVFNGLSIPAEGANTLRRLSIAQVSGLLNQCNELLNSSNLYTPANDIVTRWNGKKNLSQAAFGVADQEELKYYLQIQRDRASYLTDNYAKPLLAFLADKQMYAGQAAISLMPKWLRIRDELQKYANKDVNNSVTLLEKYILFDLDKIDLGNCFDKTQVGRLHAGTDYFKQKHDNLQRQLFQQCQNLADVQGYDSYDVIRDFFNQRLAGRFPFSGLTDDAFRQEADLESIRDFFGIYALYRSDLIKLLANTNIFDVSRDRAIMFLDNMDRVKVFFQDFLVENSPMKSEKNPSVKKPLYEKPTYDFTVEFRVNRKYENGANQIINWKIEAGGLPVNLSKGKWQ